MSQPNVGRLVGSHNLHDGTAVFRQPFETVIDNHNQLLLESLASVWANMCLEAYLVCRVSSISQPHERPLLAVMDKAATCAMEDASTEIDFKHLRETMLGQVALICAVSSPLRISKQAPYMGSPDEIGLGSTQVEVTLEPDGGAGVYDVSSNGSTVFADWSDAFSFYGHPHTLAVDSEARILSFPSKTTA